MRGDTDGWTISRWIDPVTGLSASFRSQRTRPSRDSGRVVSRSARRVQVALARLDRRLEVRELVASTRTAAEAAKAIGCTVEQIAKSVVFRGRETDRPILAVARGTVRIDESKLADLAGEPVERADADYVRARTGYAIGGVPPMAHSEPIETWIDTGLLDLDVAWAAAGTPHTVFRLTPADLIRLTGGALRE